MGYYDMEPWERKLLDNTFNRNSAQRIMADDRLSDMEKLRDIFRIYKYDIRQPELHDAIENVIHRDPKEMRYMCKEELMEHYAARLNGLIKEMEQFGIYAKWAEMFRHVSGAVVHESGNFIDLSV